MASPLDDPLARHTVLSIVARGGNVKEAAAALEINRKTIQRAAERSPRFGAALEQAKALGQSTSPESKIAIRELLRSWEPRPLPSAPKLVEVDLVPPPAIDVIAAFDGEPMPEHEHPGPPEPTIKPEPPSSQPPADTGPRRALARPGDVLVPGLPDLNERALLAYYWRTMHDPAAPVILRNTCIKAMHDHMLARQARTRLEQLDQVAVEAASIRGRDPGVPASVWEEARRNFLGPALGEEEDEGIIQDQDARRTESAASG